MKIKKGYYYQTEEVATEVEYEKIPANRVTGLKPGERPQDYLNRLKELKTGDWANNILRKNKYTVTGGVIGIVGGIVLASMFHQSKMMFAIGGMFAGAFAGNFYSKQK